MSTYRSKIYVSMLSVCLLAIIGDTFAQPTQSRQVTKLNCTECHNCESPTADNPCLKACPSLFTMETKKAHDVSEAPDSMILDRLVNQYGPVRFNHKVHASMSGMGNGCPTCHHFSPAGRIPKCGECHANQTSATNLRQPSLKGAYHRQCLSCHREWSHDTECVICHSPIEIGKLASATADTTDIIGASHPKISIPTKKVFHTPYQNGPIVTFYHDEHVELFGLRCVDCHQQENCGGCHDIQKPASLVKTQEQVHAICSNCHRADRCEKCHDNREKPAFSHSKTGWALNRFHQELECRACHPTGKQIAKLNTDCIACHGGWNSGQFRHAVTGLQLDDTHVQLECADCHVEKRFNERPSCGNCHDDGRTGKSMPPGKMIKVGRG